MPCPVSKERRAAAWEWSDLPLADQIVAAWASMIGRRFDLYLLERVSLLPEPVLRRVLADLEAHQLVHRSGEGRWEFVDEGLRRAAFRHLLGPDRRRLHAGIAQVLGTIDQDPLATHRG